MVEQRREFVCGWHWSLEPSLVWITYQTLERNLLLLLEDFGIIIVNMYVGITFNKRNAEKMDSGFNISRLVFVVYPCSNQPQSNCDLLLHSLCKLRADMWWHVRLFAFFRSYGSDCDADRDVHIITLPTGSQFYNMIPMLLTVKEYYLLKRKLREYNYLQLEPSLSVLMVNQGLLKYFELKKN